MKISQPRRHGLAMSLAAFALAALVAAPAPAAAQGDENKRINESIEVLTTLMGTPDQGIPDSILEGAEAIVVIPRLVKGGFIVGAQHGKGIMSIRDRATNTWTSPGFVALTGGSFGWQIGLQGVDLVLLVMNKEGVTDLLSSEFKLGANASVAAGPVGRSAEASTDAKASAKILAYSRAKGLFAGLTVEGAALRADKDANQKFYGRGVTQDDIIKGMGAPSTDAARAWADAMKRLTPASARTN
jgi:lipid-binding SYLF domain-containing protein